jgi:hypothetical protein
VLWGPGGVGKSTLGLKFAAGQAERGGGWLCLVFGLSASSMEQDYAGLLDAMLGKSAGRAPSYVSGVEPRLAGGPRRPARAGRRRAGEGRARVADGRVSVDAWADHHHDAGSRVGVARGGLSGSERDRCATLRLVRRGLAHDAKVWQVSAGLLLLVCQKGRAEQAQSRVRSQTQHGRRDGA